MTPKSEAHPALLGADADPVHNLDEAERHDGGPLAFLYVPAGNDACQVNDWPGVSDGLWSGAATAPDPGRTTSAAGATAMTLRRRSR